MGSWVAGWENISLKKVRCCLTQKNPVVLSCCLVELVGVTASLLCILKVWASPCTFLSMITMQFILKTHGLVGVLQLLHYLISPLPTLLFCLHRMQLLLSTNHSDPSHPLVFWGAPLSHLHLGYVWDPSTLHLHWRNGGCSTPSFLYLVSQR